MTRWLVVLCALLLNGCANDIARRIPQADEKIGLVPGDSVQKITGRFAHRGLLFSADDLDGRPVTLISVVRANEDNGNTRICAALIVSGDETVMTEVERLLVTYKVRIFLGGYPHPYHYGEALPPQSIKVHRKGLNSATQSLNLTALLPIEANCARSELKWDPAYRGGHRLVVPR